MWWMRTLGLNVRAAWALILLTPASCGDAQRDGSNVAANAGSAGSGGSGGGSSAAGSGGSSGSGVAGGAHGISCGDIGVGETTSVSDLDATQVDQVCHAYRTCSADQLTVERYCLLIGRVGARFAGPNPTDDQVRAACQSSYDECIADPAAVQATLDMTREQTLGQPCMAPTGCEATLAEIDPCATDFIASGYAELMPCAELTAAALDSEDPGAAPPSCAGLAVGCYYLFASVL